MPAEFVHKSSKCWPLQSEKELDMRPPLSHISHNACRKNLDQVSNQLSSVPEMKWYRDKRPLIHLVDHAGWAQHDRPGYEQEAHMPGSEDSQRTSRLATVPSPELCPAVFRLWHSHDRKGYPLLHPRLSPKQA
ncbi:hypothetical protein AOLI_G00007930 [Acnodon oligacanthus]